LDLSLAVANSTNIVALPKSLEFSLAAASSTNILSSPEAWSLALQQLASPIYYLRQSLTSHQASSANIVASPRRLELRHAAG